MPHIISLVFDDGFLDSTLRTAQLFESYGLRANFNVCANAKHREAVRYHTECGDFDLWNELQARGHEIMPHGYEHENYSELSFDEGKDHIDRCLAIFDQRLDGFDRSKAIFHFPYNTSTPQIEAYLDTQVRAYRAIGDFYNPPATQNTKKLTVNGAGSGDNIDAHLTETIDAFLAQDQFHWLLYNTHGLDQEGWGPVSTECLDQLLAQWSANPNVEILSPGAVLKAI